MKRIAIIGSSGSGKSTFANKLGKILNRPIIHLDKEYYNSDWSEKYPTKEDWKNFQRNLVSKDEWIIDGNYRSSLDIRLDKADTVIFFDFPNWICLWRVFKRTLNRKQPFDKPEGVREKISWRLIKFIIKYPKKEVYQIIDGYKNERKIIIVRNTKEVENLLKELSSSNL
jgi:adenylate kinase family enzyme